jgi:hypothetical protein
MNSSPKTGARAGALFVSALLLASALALPAPAAADTLAADHPATYANDWMRLLIERARAEGYSPLIASRMFAYAGVAQYEAALGGMPDHMTLAGQLHDLPPLPAPPDGELDWPAVVSAAMAALAKDLFPDPDPPTLLAFTDLYTNHNLTRIQVGVPRGVLQRSRMYGNQVADAILAWAAEDGFADTRGLPFVPPVGPAQWVPTGGSTNPLNNQAAQPGDAATACSDRV